MSDETNTQEKKPQTPAVVKKGETAESVVQSWIKEHLHNSAFSRDTPAWNHFHSKIPALVEAIKKEL